MEYQEVAVSASLQALLSQLIDYAGLFPPAQLPLEQAFRNYARYLNEAEGWMLGRFVCPAASLADLGTACADLFAQAARYSFSVLGRGGKTPQEYFAHARQDVADIRAFAQRFPDHVTVDAYEVRLPVSAFDPAKPHQLSSLIATTAFLLETTAPAEICPFFETPVADRLALLAVIQALYEDHHAAEAAGRQRCGKPGFKLRTGGLDAAAFPSVEQTALVLAACRAAQVPFKATAGLHHPLRRLDPALGVCMHGFINVFAAACLACAHALTETQLQAVLADEAPHSFTWEENGLRWRELFVPNEAIVQARRQFASFGSCSFDEPRADLRSLGWLA